MKKKVAILGIYHESNTFSQRITSWSDMTDGHLFYGNDLISSYQHAHHEIAGFLEGMAEAHVELIPVFFADILPGGTIDASAYSNVKAELLDTLASVLPLDAIYLAAHGAAVSEQIRDVDGDWMQAIRDTVGPDIPIVGSIDPHANVSVKMQQATNGLIAYATNPHLDQKLTGKKVAGLLKKILFNQIQTRQELIQFPASLSIEQQETAVEPCLSLYSKVQELLNQDEVISHSIILGFPYADVEEMGTSLILITEASFETAALKKELINLFQNYYPQFVGRRILIGDILSRPNQYAKPVLLLDMGDNVGGGAHGNSTFLLHAIEDAGLNNACICVYHQTLVAETAKHPKGEWFSIFFDDAQLSGRKTPYTVCILEIKDGKFVETSPRHGGQVQYDMGKVVLLKTSSGNYIVLTSLRVPPFSSQQLRIFDLPLEKLDWIIAKGVNAPIAAYKEICPTHLKVHTPGECNADATQFHYQYRRKPLFPFEQIDNYA